MKRFLLIVYALLSIVESLINLVSYTLFLDKFGLVADFAMPFYFWAYNGITSDKTFLNNYMGKTFRNEKTFGKKPRKLNNYSPRDLPDYQDDFQDDYGKKYRDIEEEEEEYNGKIHPKE